MASGFAKGVLNHASAAEDAGLGTWGGRQDARSFQRGTARERAGARAQAGVTWCLQQPSCNICQGHKSYRRRGLAIKS